MFVCLKLLAQVGQYYIFTVLFIDTWCKGKAIDRKQNPDSRSSNCIRSSELLIDHISHHLFCDLRGRETEDRAKFEKILVKFYAQVRILWIKQ